MEGHGSPPTWSFRRGERTPLAYHLPTYAAPTTVANTRQRSEDAPNTHTSRYEGGAFYVEDIIPRAGESPGVIQSETDDAGADVEEEETFQVSLEEEDVRNDTAASEGPQQGKRKGIEVGTLHRAGGVHKRLRTYDAASLAWNETLGGVPAEIAHMIMGFTGLRASLSIARTSKAHRLLLMQILQRDEQPPQISLKRRKTKDSYLMDIDLILTDTDYMKDGEREAYS